MRNALLVGLALFIVALLAVIFDRRVLRPRREADTLVALARPYASASQESAWITAESLLAQAELRDHGRADIKDLRAVIAAGRAAQKVKDEVIIGGALDACLAAIEKAGFGADAAKIRANIALNKRDQHVECMKVQLSHLNEIAAHASPSSSPSPSVSTK